jgi:hypothetical protein
VSNANSGFRGTTVAVSDIRIEGRGSIGTVVKYRVLFADGEGHVHASTQHEVSASEDSLFQEPVRTLLDACRRHAENVHFTSPSTPTINQVITRGIAEAASGVPDSADEPGEPG